MSVGSLRLSSEDRAMLAGRRGDGLRLAMRIVARMAQVVGAPRLIDVTSAHVDGCLYQGEVSLDFAERLAAAGARVAVPTTLNVGSLDLLHPDLYRGDAVVAERAHRLMDRYVEMGCRPTWTCAPYQLPDRPAFGQHVAWAESNAVVFANSVLGARTDRYGDFIDICAAVTGRVPDAGLHVEANRRGTVLFRLRDVPDRLMDEDVLYPVLGHLVGGHTGTGVPVLDGLPAGIGEDRLKALGAAAASSGAVALFHAVASTPEAPTLEAALQGRASLQELVVTPEDLEAARDSLSTTTRTDLAAVSLGTPHASLRQLERLTLLLEGRSVHPAVTLYVSTSRDALAAADRKGWADVLRRAGAVLVTDTCTYITPMLGRVDGPVMTDSAKWAYYAPGNIGVEVVFGSQDECVRSAVEGQVWRDHGLWPATR